MARETNVSINPVLHYNDPEKAIEFLREGRAQRT
jgi:hypothetical protein